MASLGSEKMPGNCQDEEQVFEEGQATELSSLVGGVNETMTTKAVNFEGEDVDGQISLVLGDEGGQNDEGEEHEEVVEEIEDINPAPDGGWGWFIVFGSMLVHLFIGGLERASGIMYLKFADKFQQSAAATAWATSIPSGLRLTLGPLCSVLCNRYSHRSVVITGSVILCISMIITAYSSSITFVFLSFGVLGGFGRCLAYAPAVVIVGEYFNKRRGLAVGLATSGVGFGSFLFPTVIEFVFTFYGFFGAFLILAAVMFHLAICGSLFRPLWLHLMMMSHDTRRSKAQEADIGTDARLGELIPKEYSHADVQCTTTLTKECSKMKENDMFRKSKISKYMKRLSVSSYKREPRPKAKLLELSLLLDVRFAAFCVAILLYTVAFQSAFVFIPPYAKSKGMSDMHASYAVSIAGLFDGIGRIVAGLVLDLERVRQYRIYIYNFNMFLVGFVSFVVPQLDTFVELSVVCAVYGLLVGTYISQKSVIIVDMLGVKKLVNSFGLLICFQGIGMFIGPPLAGFMKDLNGHYKDGFYLGGAAMIFGAFILVASNVFYYLKRRKEV